MHRTSSPVISTPWNLTRFLNVLKQIKQNKTKQTLLKKLLGELQFLVFKYSFHLFRKSEEITEDSEDEEEEVVVEETGEPHYTSSGESDPEVEKKAAEVEENRGHGTCLLVD